MKWLAILCCIFSGVQMGYCGTSRGLLKEYCYREEFTAECTSNEIIQVESAYYGQMNIGRCVDGDYGYLGCTSNQLLTLDKECSGKQNCQIVVEDSSMTEEMNCSIPKIFMRYLEASFSCIHTYRPSEERCETSHVIPLKSRPVNIASITTEQTQCGQETKPWVLEAKPGQKINISLTDFNWNVQQPAPNCAIRYGFIIDNSNNQLTDICGGIKRQHHVYISEGNSVQIMVLRSPVPNARFMLTVKVIGCPKYSAPEDTWTEVNGKTITVGCVHNENSWKMRCIGNHWIGIKGDCTRRPNAVKNQEKEQSEEYTVFGLTPVIGFSLMASVFLIIICVAVTTIIGLFCIKKSKQEQSKEYYMAPFQYPGNTHTLITLPRPPATNNLQQTLLTTQQARPEAAAGLLSREGSNVTRAGPQYFVLENGAESQKDPVYDAVYQNIGDMNSA